MSHGNETPDAGLRSCLTGGIAAQRSIVRLRAGAPAAAPRVAIADAGPGTYNALAAKRFTALSEAS